MQKVKKMKITVPYKRPDRKKGYRGDSHKNKSTSIKRLTLSHCFMWMQ